LSARRNTVVEKRYFYCWLVASETLVSQVPKIWMFSKPANFGTKFTDLQQSNF